MRKILVFLLLAIVLVAGASWLALLPGTVRLQSGPWLLETSTPVAIFAVLLSGLVLGLLWRGVTGLARLPRRLRESKALRRREAGDAAVTRAMVALASRNGRDAVTEATRARKLLRDAPHTLALAAEAHRLAGQKDEARARLTTLAAEPRTAMIGLRGLVEQALERDDTEAARGLLERARYLDPGSVWLRETEARLARTASPIGGPTPPPLAPPQGAPKAAAGGTLLPRRP